MIDQQNLSEFTIFSEVILQIKIFQTHTYVHTFIFTSRIPRKYSKYVIFFFFNLDFNAKLLKKNVYCISTYKFLMTISYLFKLNLLFHNNFHIKNCIILFCILL